MIDIVSNDPVLAAYKCPYSQELKNTSFEYEVLETFQALNFTVFDDLRNYFDAIIADSFELGVNLPQLDIALDFKR